MPSVVYTIVIGILAVLVVIGFLASMKPNSFSISRSIAIRAKPETVFRLIDRFPAWHAWSPWDKVDPAMQRTFSGKESGVGAVYSWRGNGKVGAGSMTIVEATAFSRIVIRLLFEKPMKADNRSIFVLTPEGEGTLVEWTMTGPSPFVSKVFWLLFNVEKRIGAEVEKGLRAMKDEAERARA
jgi:uncharacterized protein YndB with AHSA1/START domain